MKRLTMRILLVTVLALLGIAWINSDIFAQEKEKTKPLPDQLNELKIEIPFIDRDGDGINDLLQNGWGLRFIERYKNRRAVWNQMMNDEEFGKQMIDTDGDGVPDTPFRKMLHEYMNKPVDTDGDGEPDTPMGEYMRRRFHMMDLNGDGIPDELTPEQIHNHLQEMREWRENIRQNLMNGLPAFTDLNGDGIPDNFPKGLSWMGRRRHKGRGE